MIEELTSQQEKRIPEIINYWDSLITDGNTEIDYKKIQKGLSYLYQLSGLKCPMILYADSPLASQLLANFIKNTGENLKENIEENLWENLWKNLGKNLEENLRENLWKNIEKNIGKKLIYFNSSWRDIFDCNWVAFYLFGEEIGVKYSSENSRGLKNYCEFLKGGTFLSILFERLAIICRKPKIILRDERKRLHSSVSPAVVWRDEVKNYFWHGILVSEKIIMRPNDLTIEEILNERNSEVSRAIAEKLGWENYLKKIGSVLIDKWFDVNTSCHYELYDFKKRRFPLMPRLLKMESPELKDGTRPFYIEPVHHELETCQAARRWQFYKPDLTEPTVKECNKFPELVFEREA